jgi:amino-acid N-acetyltransferase
MHKLTDLREILRYVPSFRDKVFVVAVDGEIVEDDNFANILLDIALLRSLSVHVVLVHGTGHQLRKLAATLKQPITNSDGTGITDEPTLKLALTVANRLTHEILEGLASADLRAACTNAVIAHPAGILKGVDQQFTGKIEKIDAPFLQTMLNNDIVPVVPPLGFDGEGRTFRCNSDAVASQIALSLKAIKLIFITTVNGIIRNGKLQRQISAEEASEILKKHREDLDEVCISKLDHAFKAISGGVERVHVVDGRTNEGLLGEVFSSAGVGTLIYANEYQAIRPAVKRDARTIMKLIDEGVANEELVKRTRVSIEKQINDFYVFEVDGNPAGCVALHPYDDEEKAEMACLMVSSAFENRGIGRKLMAFAERTARDKGYKQLLTLSTQAFSYFQQKGNFREATPTDLPRVRRQQLEQSKRNSRILIKDLTRDSAK